MEKTNTIELVQPNRVTNAKYNFSEREEDILTLMIDSIQGHMSTTRQIQTDLFNQPIITIDCNDVGASHKRDYIKAVHSMRKKDFEFEWQDQQNRTIETTGSMITTLHNYKGTSRIDIVINPWAIPYLLYWGKGVGGTIFNKAIAISLKGQYTKRMYKMSKRWEDRGGFGMPLDEFREMLDLGRKYPKIADLKKWVLDPAEQRLKDGADVYFKYAITKVGNSRSLNYITFSVHGNNKKRSPAKKTDMYVFIYNILNMAWPNHKSSKAQELCDRISERPDKFEELYRRFKRLKNEFDTNEKPFGEVVALIHTIIKRDHSG